ncbi:MAG: beta-lactamase family protein [Gammaproteobacteria bacterium]|nr:beta-lactamase family protein [Gammaproteobacteria bacterium]
MSKKIQLLVLWSTVLVFSGASAEQSGRPDGLTLANFQFGPVNRWAFSHMREVVPTANIAHDNRRVLVLERSDAYVSDFSVRFQGRERTIDEIAASEYLDGLLVLKDGRIVFEKYYGHLTEARPHLMNSVSKSVLGVLAGRLAADGVIDLAKPVSHYVPALANGGWGPDSLRTLLDMRDGADYTEDYPDFTTTFRIQDCAIGWTDADYCPKDIPRGGYAFFPTIGRDEANLGHFHYKSGSTSVIGWVMEAATGRPLAELISAYIWKPMGAEFDANITVDASGFALGDHGMSSTLRDLGRFGLLVLNKGRAFGEQVIPADFIEDMHAQPASPDWPYPDWPSPTVDGKGPYYRSYWWGKGNDEKDLLGYGIHGQTVRVAPGAGVVIALYSTWPRADGDGTNDFWTRNDELTDALVAKFR